MLGTQQGIEAYFRFKRVGSLPTSVLSTGDPTVYPNFIQRNYPANGVARARNSPTLDGEVIAIIPAGTVLFGYEQRIYDNSMTWLRITDYEAAINNSTLWVAIFYVSQILTQTPPTNCAQLTPEPLSSITPYPTTTYPFQILSPPVIYRTDRHCPLSGTNSTDLQIVSFVLACESGVASPIIVPERVEDAQGYYACNLQSNELCTISQ